MAGGDAGDRYDRVALEARRRLRDRCVWHVNATAEGGGVAELLSANLGYLAADGIRTRWLAIEAEPAFFEITKRIHNRLHGGLGDGGPLGEHERDVYRATLASQSQGLRRFVRPGDVIVVHDPQPLGLVPGLRALGATVVWTCHVGVDIANDVVRSAWSFLAEYVRWAQAATFTRDTYVWDGLASMKIRLIPPCIDPLSPKNIELSHRDVAGILTAAGIVAPTAEQPHGSPRTDGSLTRVRSPAGLTEVNATPSNASIVVQVSRWDALKDPLGVMDGFVEWVRRGDTHLILAGPTPSSVDDDPEASAVLAQVRQRWSGLPDQVKWRVHLANLAVDDPSENAIVVNALQRRSDVLVQKSLAEGFGLTVTEAMWKMRPVVGSRVGGIQEQIDDGLNGLLVDPRDPGAFGSAVTTLLDDPVHAASLGVEGRRRVEERFLPTHYLAAYLRLFLELLGEDRG